MDDETRHKALDIVADADRVLDYAKDGHTDLVNR
jgi:hypothetical protein